jgi:hypothetical protein
MKSFKITITKQDYYSSDNLMILEMFLEHIFSDPESSDKKVYSDFHVRTFMLHSPATPQRYPELKECNVSLKFSERAASYSGKCAFLLNQTTKPKFLPRLQNKIKTTDI